MKIMSNQFFVTLVTPLNLGVKRRIVTFRGQNSQKQPKTPKTKFLTIQKCMKTMTVNFLSFIILNCILLYSTFLQSQFLYSWSQMNSNQVFRENEHSVHKFRDAYFSQSPKITPFHEKVTLLKPDQKNVSIYGDDLLPNHLNR